MTRPGIGGHGFRGPAPVGALAIEQGTGAEVADEADVLPVGRPGGPKAPVPLEGKLAERPVGQLLDPELLLRSVHLAEGEPASRPGRARASGSHPRAWNRSDGVGTIAIHVHDFARLGRAPVPGCTPGCRTWTARGPRRRRAVRLMLPVMANGSPLTSSRSRLERHGEQFARRRDVEEVTGGGVATGERLDEVYGTSSSSCPAPPVRFSRSFPCIWIVKSTPRPFGSATGQK